jgi:hypothetical protein
MIPAWIERALWGGAAALAVVAVLGWRSAAYVDPGVESLLPYVEAPQPLADAAAFAAAQRTVTTTDPFRTARRPSAVPFAPGGAEDGEERTPPSRDPVPALVLAGVLGGPPWQAVLQGVPGRSGSLVVREGERVEELLISLVTQDSVVVETADTTLVLTVRQPWR